MASSLHKCIQRGLGRSTPRTPILCQQHLGNGTTVWLEGPLWPCGDTSALLRPNPVLQLNMHLPGCHSIPATTHSATETGSGYAMSVGCVPPPPGTIL